MGTTKGRLTHVTIAIGALVLAMTAATPALGKGGTALTIRAVVVRGNEVAITVANHTARTQTGMVTSRVLTRAGVADVVAPVTAAAGQTVTVKVVLPAPVLDEIPLGVVVDDGVPF